MELQTSSNSTFPGIFTNSVSQLHVKIQSNDFALANFIQILQYSSTANNY